MELSFQDQVVDITGGTDDIGLASGARHITEYVDMYTLLSRSNVIVLHCYLLPSTKDVICKRTSRR